MAGHDLSLWPGTEGIVFGFKQLDNEFVVGLVLGQWMVVRKFGQQLVIRKFGQQLVVGFEQRRRVFRRRRFVRRWRVFRELVRRDGNTTDQPAGA